MKLKIGPTRKFRASTPAVPHSTAWAPSSASAIPSGLTSTRRIPFPVGPDDYKKIDPKKLAEELEVDMCVVNHGRFWMMDEDRGRRRRHGQLSWCRYELGRRHDRGRDGRPVRERLFAVLDQARHHLDLARWQAGASAARAGRPGLGPAGIHQGGRSEPDPRQPQQVGRQAENLAERLDVRNQGAGQGPGAGYGSQRAGGPPSFATTCTAPIRPAATARTPAPTTCHNPSDQTDVHTKVN